MVKPYSVDLRERVVRFVMSGHPRHQATAHFGVSVSSTIKWVAAYLARGELTPKPLRGRRFSKLEPYRAFLIATVEKQPDITMLELAAALMAKGTRVDPASISWWLRRNNFRYKKALLASEQDRSDIRTARADWIGHASRESGVSHIGLSSLMKVCCRGTEGVHYELTPYRKAA